MADSLDSAGIIEGLTQSNDALKNIDGKLGGGINAKVDGITEIQKTLDKAVAEVPPILQDILTNVAVINKLEPLLQSLAKSNENFHKEQTVKEKKQNTAEHKKEVGKTKGNVSPSDMQQLPAAFGNPALFLSHNLKDLIWYKSGLFENRIKEFGDSFFGTKDAKFFKSFAEAFPELLKPKEAGKEESGGGGKTEGPNVDFKGEKGFAKIADTITLFSVLAKDLVTAPIIRALFSMNLMSKFIDRCVDVVQNHPADNKAIEDFEKFTIGAENSFWLIHNMAISVFTTLPFVLKATTGLDSIDNFLEESIISIKLIEKKMVNLKVQEIETFLISLDKAFGTVRNLALTVWKIYPFAIGGISGLSVINDLVEEFDKVLGKKDWPDLKDKASKLALFSSSIHLALKSLTQACLWASLLSMVALTGTLGVRLANKFIVQVFELLNLFFNKAATYDKNTVEEYRIIIEITADLIKHIVIAAAWASVMMMVGLTGILGLLLARIFLEKGIFGLLSQLDRLQKKEKDIENSKKVVNKLVSLFKKLVLVMILASLAGMFAIVATFALVGIVVFLLGVALLGALSMLLQPVLAAFDSTIVMLALSMLLFAVTLWFISTVLMPGIFFKQIMLLLLNVAIFMIGAALLGVLALFLIIPIALFTAASLLLAIGFLALYVALLILNRMPIDKKTIDKIVLVGQFMASLSLLLPFMLPALLATLILVLVSALLLVGMIFLLIAVILIFVVAFFISKLMSMEFDVKGMKAPDGFGGFIAVLALFFMGFMLLLPILLYSLLPIILLMVVSILLFVSFFMLTLTLLLALAITKIIIKNPEVLLVGAMLIPFFISITLLGLVSLLVIIAAVPLLVASVLLLASFVALTATIALALAISKMLENAKLVEMVGGLLAFFGVLIPLGLLSILMIVVVAPLLVASVMLLAVFVALTATIALALAMQKLGDKINVQTINDKVVELFSIFGLKLAAKALKVIAVTAPILLAVTMMLGIFSGIVGCYLAIKKLSEIQDRVDPKPVFEAVNMLTDIVKAASDKMKDSSTKALKNFNIGIGGVIKAIESIVDTIIKISDPKMVELVEPACDNLEIIIKRFFGLESTAAPFSILDILTKIGKIDKKQLLATQALVPLTEAISNIVDVIKKVVEIEDIEKGIEQTRLVVDFVGELQKFANNFSGGFFGLGSSESKIKAAIKATGGMEPLLDNVSKLGKLAGDMPDLGIGISNTKKMVTFVSDLQKFAEGFSSGGFFSKSSSDQIRTAVNSTAAMKPLMENVAALGEIANGMPQFKVDLTELIIVPLTSDLDPAIRTLRAVKDGVHALNSELTKLSKDNRDTLKGISNIGSGTADGIKGFVMKLNTAFSKVSSGGKKDDGKKDPMEQIANDVRGIAKAVIKNDKNSWTEN